MYYTENVVVEMFSLPLNLWKLRTIGLLFTSHTYIPESVNFVSFITNTHTSPPDGNSDDSSSDVAENIKKKSKRIYVGDCLIIIKENVDLWNNIKWYGMLKSFIGRVNRIQYKFLDAIGILRLWTYILLKVFK